MKEVDNNFKEQVKAKVRQSEISIMIGDTSLTSEDIESLEYKAEILKEIGGIEVELLRVSVLKARIPDSLFNTKTSITVYVFINNQRCVLCELITSFWNKKDKSLFVEIEARSSFEYDRSIPFLATKRNTRSSEFIKDIMALTGTRYSFEGLDSSLKVAMLSGNKIGDTLKQLAISTQSIVRYRNKLEFKSFKGGSPMDSILYDELLINANNGRDSETEFDKVTISVYMPTESELKEIGKFEKATVPNGSSSFNLGTLTFDKPKIVGLLIFDNDVDIESFHISSDKVSVNIANRKPNTIDVNTTIKGFDLMDNSLESNEDTTNKVKNIKNIYIQDSGVISSYDTRIYTNPFVEVDYRGNPAIEIGDTITIEEIGDILVTEHTIKFDGAISGTIKGVVL